MSLNKFYAGMHWTERRSEVNRVRTLIGWELKRKGITVIGGKHIFTTKVKVIITAFFAKSPLDPDNIVSKLYIDSFKEFLLLDDSHTYIHSVTTISKIDKENPRLEIALIAVS